MSNIRERAHDAIQNALDENLSFNDRVALEIDYRLYEAQEELEKERNEKEKGRIAQEAIRFTLEEVERQKDKRQRRMDKILTDRIHGGGIGGRPKKILKLNPFAETATMYPYRRKEMMIPLIDPSFLSDMKNIKHRIRLINENGMGAEKDEARLRKELHEAKQDLAELGLVADSANPKEWAKKHGELSLIVEELEKAHTAALRIVEKLSGDLDQAAKMLRDKNPLFTYADMLEYQSLYAIRFWESFLHEAQYLKHFNEFIQDPSLDEDEVTFYCLLLLRKYGMSKVDLSVFQGAMFISDKQRKYATIDLNWINEIDPGQLDYVIGWKIPPAVEEDKNLIAEALDKLKGLLAKMK